MAVSAPPGPVPAPPPGRGPARSLPPLPAAPGAASPRVSFSGSVPSRRPQPSAPTAGRRWARPAPRSRGRAAAVKTRGKSFRERAAPHPSSYCRGSAGGRPPPSGGSREQPLHKGCAPRPPDSGSTAPADPFAVTHPQTRRPERNTVTCRRTVRHLVRSLTHHVS
ncbi:translation initiation factor IF-2 [Globicephala melas]|uniref:translation initiation factor IF-2 n=1 Tax=Globicephala melas TaxID=9731 RepID=UPI003873C176